MRVIIPLANGFEEIEAITLVDVLRRGGIEVVTLSLDEFGMDVEGSHKIGLVADEVWNDADVEAADMIVLPGGMVGMRTLKADARVLETIRLFDKQEKGIGAICAAPVVLSEAGVLNGRQAVCYPGMEANLHGAVFQPGASVVRDGHIITASGPATAMVFALAVLEMLAGSACRAETAKGLLFADPVG